MTDQLKKIDLFASNFQLRFKNQDSYPTKLGGFLTLIIFGLSIAVAISSGDRIYERARPQINRNLVYSLARNYNLLEFLPFYYNFISDKSYDESYVSLNLVYYKRVITVDKETGVSKGVTTRSNIDWEKCGDNLDYHLNRFNSFGQGTNFTETLLANGFQSSMCITETENNKNMVLGGEYSSGFYGTLYLDVIRCTNSTTSTVVCATKEDQATYLKTKNMQLNYLHYIIDTENYSNPFDIIHGNTYYKMDPSFYFQINSFYMPVDVTSDVGLLFTDEKTQSKPTADTIVTYSSFIDTGVMARWYITISQRADKYNRYYMKLQDLAAVVGGIINVLMVASYFTSSFFNKYLRERTMINTFFSYNIHYNNNDFNHNNDKLGHSKDKLSMSFDGNIDEYDLKSKINLFTNKKSIPTVKKDSSNFLESNNNLPSISKFRNNNFQISHNINKSNSNNDIDLSREFGISDDIINNNNNNNIISNQLNLNENHNINKKNT